MNDEQRSVASFHWACDVPALPKPTLPPIARARLRVDLLEEEVREFREAVLEGGYDRDPGPRLGKIARELADILYVAYGAALEFGIDLAPIFAAVHRANMRKVGPTGKVKRRADGKVLKPAGFVGPDDSIRTELAIQAGEE